MIRKDRPATRISTSTRAYKRLLLMVRRFAIVNVTRSVSASSSVISTGYTMRVAAADEFSAAARIFSAVTSS